MFEAIKLPELQPMLRDDTVVVPTDEFKKLIEYVNKIAEATNAHSTVIAQTSEALTTCKQDISNIARILEEVYDEA
jgi:hypothetical protein